MDYSKLHWYGDFMSYEIYGEGVDEFVVGLYCLKDFPEINLYINVDESKIIEVFLEDE